MLQFIDVEGLAPHAANNADLLQIVREIFPSAGLVEGEQRSTLLSQLRDGAGVQVITGPLGKEWWSLASIECQVSVWPDGYDYKERHDVHTWALIAAGVEVGDAKGLVKSHVSKGKTPTAKHKLYPAFMRGEELRHSLPVAEALVHEDVEFNILSIDEGVALLESLTETGELAAADWEWHRQTQEPVGLAVSTERDNYYVPVWASDCDYRADGGRIQAAFTAAVMDGARLILHGGRADLGTQVVCDPIEVATPAYRVEDTMVMAYLLGEPVLGLKPLARKYLNRDPIENEYEWAEMPVRFTARYAAGNDTRNTYDLFILFDRALDALGTQADIYRNLERPLVPIIASMERAGVPVHIPTVKRLYREYVAVEFGLRRSVLENYGRDLADDEDTRRFITDFGFADPGTLDQRVISLNMHWCIDLILEYRKHRTRRRNFLKKHLLFDFLMKNPDKLDKKLRPIKQNMKKRGEFFTMRKWTPAGEYRVFPRFNQAGSMDADDKTAPRTGRLSSSDPNLQNQPRDIREIYLPPPGTKWWSFDYSGLELHIAAGLSGDPNMKPATMHTDFQMFIKEKTGKDVGRPAAKTGNFEQLYEGGADQLVRIMAKMRAVLEPTDADIIVESHHELFAGYHNAGKEWVEEARDTGFAQTYDGRLRAVPELWSPDGKTALHGERAAQNHKVQGTAADKVKEAMINVVPVLRKYGAHMALQVHDELDGWVPEDVDIEAFAAEVQAVMEGVEIPRLKLKVEGGVGESWAETH